ncbi:Plasmodium variant antigen protein Cir/Yir/Bir, putative [Plasmodium chabaudi adami]|uniref:Plasmodium variant antigen protein Cir/Yir/Bir, putative n=1 Tax=Plasmodium chabaudi adami TaxID=5826 RepID=A0A1C6WLZ3_PLACE|nr:Plasmodium variant antigen protein Cir/Yir/Bir, putative [Plasmodium chabaudi adami]
MGDQQLCKLILDADNLFTNDQVVNEAIFKQDGRYDQYCHVKNGSKKCETNIHRIGALSTYLFIQLEAYSNNDYGKYFLMWLSDKLYNIVKDENDGKDKKITLNEAYDEYLKNNIGNYNYWNVLYNIRGLKDANLRHMRELYKLLMYICKTIADYKRNGANNRNLRQKSVNCINQYRNLYNNLPKCNSYLHLLDKLKKIYEDFRDNAIKNNNDPNNNLDKRLQKLTTTAGHDSYFANKFKEFDFNNSECVQLNSKTEHQQPQPSSAQVENKEKAETLPPKSLLQSVSQLSTQSSQTEKSNQSFQLNELKDEPSSDENTEDDGLKEETQQSTSIIQEPTNGFNNIESDKITEHHISAIDMKGNIFNEYKLIAFSVIAIAIPVILAVMYKFLAPVWRKKLKKKKMKKIINLCDEKKTKKEVANTFIEKNQSE